MPRRWVLLVSVDPAMLAALETCLEGAGVHVTTSLDSAHAAAQARDLRPALIITDVKFDSVVPLMLIQKSTDLGRLRRQVDELLNPAPPPAPAPLRAEAIRISPAPRRGRRWVLLVHEDPNLEGVVEESLAGLGLHLTTVTDVRLAAVQIRDLKPVLIVSDRRAPDILALLRRDPSAERTPFILIVAAGGGAADAGLPPDDPSVRGIVRPFEPVAFKELALQVMAAASGEAL